MGFPQLVGNRWLVFPSCHNCRRQNPFIAPKSIVSSHRNGSCSSKFWLKSRNVFATFPAVSSQLTVAGDDLLQRREAVQEVLLRDAELGVLMDVGPEPNTPKHE